MRKPKTPTIKVKTKPKETRYIKEKRHISFKIPSKALKSALTTLSKLKKLAKPRPKLRREEELESIEDIEKTLQNIKKRIKKS